MSFLFCRTPIVMLNLLLLLLLLLLSLILIFGYFNQKKKRKIHLSNINVPFRKQCRTNPRTGEHCELAGIISLGFLCYSAATQRNRSHCNRTGENGDQQENKEDS